jgi:hypothetical protein
MNAGKKTFHQEYRFIFIAFGPGAVGAVDAVDGLNIKEVLGFFEVFREEVSGRLVIVHGSAGIGDNVPLDIDYGNGNPVFHDTMFTIAHMKRHGQGRGYISFLQIGMGDL